MAFLKLGLRLKSCMVCHHRGGLVWDVTVPQFPRQVELCGDCRLWSEHHEGRSYARRLSRGDRKPRMAPAPAVAASPVSTPAGAAVAVAVAAADFLPRMLRRGRSEAVQRARQAPILSRRETVTAEINSRQRRTSRRSRNATT